MSRPMLDRMADTAALAGSKAPEDLSIDEIRARIFALPVPPLPSPRRTYPIDTVLGRLMRLKGLKIRDVVRWDGCPDERKMCDILAGRAPIASYRVPLARGLGVDPEIL